MQLILGFIAFVMFFIGDYNDWRLKNPVLKCCFPLGSLLIAAAVVYGCIFNDGIELIPLIIPALLFLGLLIYTLFFAIPAKDAYVSQETGRESCTSGMYGICRHPGVLWFCGLFVCLYLMGIVNFSSLVAFNILNVVLVVFEDIKVFPDTLEGYDRYKEAVPFLIPAVRITRLLAAKKIAEN